MLKLKELEEKKLKREEEKKKREQEKLQKQVEKEAEKERKEQERKEKERCVTNVNLIFPRILISQCKEQALKLATCFENAMLIPEKIYNEIRNL